MTLMYKRSGRRRRLNIWHMD